MTDPRELLAVSLWRYSHHKSSSCSTPGLSTLSIAALHLGPWLLQYYFWVVQDVFRQTQHKKAVISETAAGLAQLQHRPQEGLESGSHSPALVTWAWVPHTSTKFSTTTAHGGDTTTTRIWLCSCKCLCCKIRLKDKWLCGLCHLAGWAHTPAFWGAYVWIEGLFSDPVTAPGLARFTSFFWECLRAELSFEAFKPKRSKFYEPEKHKVHSVLTPCAQFAYFPNKPSLSRPRSQHEICKCGQLDSFIFDEQS